MSLWASTVLGLLLLQTAPSQAQVNDDNTPAAIDEDARPSAQRPRPVVLRKDWDLTQAYVDVFNILSDQNACSKFYGGPRMATTVLNDFVPRVKTKALLREVSFEMVGMSRLIHNPNTGASYRVFEKTLVNSNGSFYQRRQDVMHKFPSDVGNFAPGSRQARALILLHELGHLIQGENGDWLIPDDGYDGPQSRANTLRVQDACRTQLKTLN
jgi:hypothetical protein